MPIHLFQRPAGCLTGSFSVRRVTAPGYLEELIELVRSQGIGLIVPTIDTELLLLAEHRETLLRHGARVLVPDLQLVQVCRDKRLIHAFFSEHGIQTARNMPRMITSCRYISNLTMEAAVSTIM